MENQNNLVLNEQAVAALRESAKWCKFLSILGFIGIGFMLIAAVFMSSFLSMMPEQPTNGLNPFSAIKGFIGIIYAIIAVLYFFPIYYLYKYSTGAKQAIESENSDVLSDALINLKSHHKFLGITAIVVISLYIVMIIGLIIFAAKTASGM